MSSPPPLTRYGKGLRDGYDASLAELRRAADWLQDNLDHGDLTAERQVGFQRDLECTRWLTARLADARHRQFPDDPEPGVPPLQISAPPPIRLRPDALHPPPTCCRSQ
ncbi:hypothetical protein AB0H34_20485 [Saccharopolyspora shandongensis]|uniref:hypothetical protein n=1 Tax=Saccharopolyspora shandongensis TaxID=418495 RepID=UPI0033DD24A8